MNEIFKPVTKEEQEAVSSLPPGYVPLTEEVLQEAVVTVKTNPVFSDLTEEQLQEIVKRVQAVLLKQAKRSRRTGIKRTQDET